MKHVLAMIIFPLLLVFPAFAQEKDFFISTEDGTKTTQFNTDDSIYIEGFCAIAASDERTKVYITNDETWDHGKSLYDVSSGIESFSTTNNGAVPRLLIWKSPLKEGAYDLVLDVNNNTTWQTYENCILGASDTGFRVGNPAPPPPPASPSPPPAPEPAPPAPPPAPPPPPPPPATPSKMFSLDDRVEVNHFANIRQTAGGSILGQQEDEAQGTVIGGPAWASVGGTAYWFWHINFDQNPDGWVAESTLKKSTAPLLPVAESEPPSQPPTATTSEPAITEVFSAPSEPPQQETDQTKLAQVSETKPLTGSLIIGLAIFLGLIVGSSVIAGAMRRGGR